MEDSTFVTLILTSRENSKLGFIFALFLGLAVFPHPSPAVFIHAVPSILRGVGVIGGIQGSLIAIKLDNLVRVC